MDKVSIKHPIKTAYSDYGWYFKTNSIGFFSGTFNDIEEAYDEKLSVVIVTFNDYMTIKDVKKFIPNLNVEFDEYSSKYLSAHGWTNGDYKYLLEFTGESPNSQLKEIWIKNL